ncbi:hypothetical protein K7I13_06430 [Brucepastera parasyntrophica]|uniref:hypothetical protein n=1 Tax=Brucepastera parasyntrophica TaxID=2880008 RepID=UPI00210AE262|nr:hypothetical protein [Brucepastera parasyntrophica]ULQ60894.1 hypothetical protein K7I13_06430 [Brucepastera parasyntrophica]
MIPLDKFHSDANKICKHMSPAGGSGNGAAQELARLFLSYTKQYGNIGYDLITYWNGKYDRGLADPQTAAAAIDWLTNALALLSGEFTKEMDFPDADWMEIRDCITAEADNLDIDLLTSIMSVFVERGKT